MHILSLTLFLVIIWLTLKFVLDGNKWSYAVWSGVLSLLMFLNHFYETFSMIGILTVILLVVIWKKYNIINYLKYLIIVFLITLPGVLYYVYLVIAIPAFNEVALTNVMPSPNLFFYISSFFLLLFLAILGIIQLIRNKEMNSKLIFLTSWLFVQFILLYSPLPFNRRLD
jgi:hypothetical protein